MSEVETRPAREDDIAAITSIYAHHVRNGLASFEEVPPNPEEMLSRLQGIRSQGLPYVVAALEGETVGYAYASLYRTRSAYRFTVEDSVYLRHDLTGRGIGRHLLARIVLECEALGFRRMIAVIGDSGNRPSIRLHEIMGFNFVGILPSVGFKLGRWVDVVLMERPLGSADATLPAHHGKPCEDDAML